MERSLNPKEPGTSEDWYGDHAAFTCPVCTKVFVVTGLLNRNGRPCPNCRKSTGYVKGGKNNGGAATITWSQ